MNVFRAALAVSTLALLLALGSGARAADPVRIGVVYPLSGPTAVAGQDAKRGTDLAVEVINAAGGIKSLGGAKLEVVYGDSQGKPVNAVSEAERLINQEKVVLMVGAHSSAETIPMTQVSEKYRVPHLVTIAQHESITGRGFKWVWSSSLLDSDYARGLLTALDMLNGRLNAGLKRVVVIHLDNEYGHEMERLLRAALSQRKDVELVATVSYNIRAQDLSPAVNKVKAANPDVVLQVGYFGDGVKLARTYQQLGLHPVVVGTGGASGDPKLKEQIGALVEGQFATIAFSDDRPAVQALVQAFRRRYNQPITLNSALGYQGILVIREVLEKAGSTDREAIARAFRSIRMEGPSVITAYDFIQFDDAGRNKGRNTVITQFQNGELVTVWPEEKATRKPVVKRFNTP